MEDPDRKSISNLRHPCKSDLHCVVSFFGSVLPVSPLLTRLLAACTLVHGHGGNTARDWCYAGGHNPDGEFSVREALVDTCGYCKHLFLHCHDLIGDFLHMTACHGGYRCR